MKYKYLLPIFAFSLMLASCGGKKHEKKEKGTVYDITNIDETVDPANDFYAFATNGWAKKHPLKDEYARYGSFDELAERNKEQVKGIIEAMGADTYPQGSIEQKIGTLFELAMDSAKLNKEQAAPLQPQLDAINAMQTKGDALKQMVDLSIYASAPFIGIYTMADQKDSDNNLVRMYAAGLGMGEKEYYLSNDSVSKELRKGYMAMMQKQFELLGYSAKDAALAASNVMSIETTLAKSYPSKESKRDPYLNYNKIDVASLPKVIGNLDWDAFFGAYNAAGASKFDSINVGQTQGLVQAVKLFNTLPMDQIKQFYTWKLVNSASSYLSDDFYKNSFDFYGVQMQGRKAMQPRWKRAVGAVEGGLGEAVGRIYVQEYFPAEAKERMLELVSNLQTALGKRIDNLTWMSDSTKVKAHEKLNTFHVKIGYPDKWKDYSPLSIENDSYWANMVRISQFETRDNLSRIGKPVDKDEWLMNPQTVNAYYMPTTNEICFPAGILQPPFFFLDGDDATNYGAIGVVIGHEMSHGFDDQGSKYDKDGNLQNWWTEIDKVQFDKRTKVLVDHFNGIEVLPGLNANGQYTLGENIGDYGGLQIAYEAFKDTKEYASKTKIDGFTPSQRFFLAYAGLWAGNIRPEEVRRLTQLDVHSLGKWRVNGTLPHIDGWYEAWGVQEGDSLFIPVEQRAEIW